MFVFALLKGKLHQQPNLNNLQSPKTNPEEVVPTPGPPDRLQQNPTPTRPDFSGDPFEKGRGIWRKGAPVAVF